MKAILRSRAYRVLALETSCDDCCAAVIHRRQAAPPVLESHVKFTLNSVKAGGIIPTDALEHHLGTIPRTVQDAIAESRALAGPEWQLDLICATQGPGFFSSLAAGMQFAKGMAVALNVPFVPVHHMLGHLLTPRFFSGSLSFPFNSLLVSGGHTMLVHSRGLREHEILVNTIDISVGNSLDKCARSLGMKGNMLGRELHLFVGERDQISAADKSRYDEHFTMALDGYKKRVKAFSFAHYATLMQKLRSKSGREMSDVPLSERRAIGAAIEDSMFYHILQKLKLAFEDRPDVRDLPLVVSGGVAANTRLKKLLKEQIGGQVVYSDPKWCTDNALMIGWAGIELYESGFMAGADSLNASLDAIPRTSWPLTEL